MQFTGRVKLNTAFVNVLREQQGMLTRILCLTVPAMTVASLRPRLCSPESRRKPWNAFLTSNIERQIVLGCFVDPSSLMIAESQRFIDQLRTAKATMCCLMHSL